ncbi:MAG TPA: proton-conducting transporter membrane subunit [Alphaproteobacteria bacterium]|nr:proton-conducting transporter membrane subunit [Alphaproteobacteria bacterium]
MLLIVAAVGMLLGILSGRSAPRLWLISTLTGAVAALAGAVMVISSRTDWEWSSRFLVGGDPVKLCLDGLSGFFLILLSIVGGAGALYSREYWPDSAHPRSAGFGRIWWNGLLLSLGFVLLSANGFQFLIAWELFTLSAYFLITTNREKSDVRAAGWLYLGASHAATLALFAFFSELAAHTGSWELGPMREHAELSPLFWLALFGFGIKAGVFPLHVWLPSAHANAPSHVSAILSGVTLKMGIYGLVRFSGWLPLPDGAGWVVSALGVVSAVLGVAFALGQHDLKRLLAYHSVENIGIILIGLGFAIMAVQQNNSEWGRLALAGALLHVWNHGLFKALLFFGAGSVVHATGTREMSRLGGLWRAMPWTTSLFALGAVAICGLPPLNGFVSEWLVYLGLFDATILRGTPALAAITAAIFLSMTGALALACFAKVCGVVFLGAPRSPAALRAHESGPAMRNAMLTLGAACVMIGLAPVAVWPAVGRAMDVWNPAWAGAAMPVALPSLSLFHVSLAIIIVVSALWLWQRVRRTGPARLLTWDCGYVQPSARMQYTAGSFAGIINEWFAWVLRPERHRRPPEGPFPLEAQDAEHTPETMLEKIVQPAALVVLRISTAARRLQHGRVQSYLLYLLIGIGVLSLLVLVGEAR